MCWQQVITCCSCYRMLQNAFFLRTRDLLVSQKTMQRHFFFVQPSVPFPRYFWQLQQYWHLYCFAILGSTSTVIHRVKQLLLRNWPGSALQPLVTSLLKDYKAHSLQQTSFAESPISLELFYFAKSYLYLELCNVSTFVLQIIYFYLDVLSALPPDLKEKETD